MDPSSSKKQVWRRTFWFVAPAVLLIGVLALAVARSTGTPDPGDPAPAFEAPLLQGEGDLALEDLDGKPVLLNFWASWCAPCRVEAPLLKSAHERYGDRVEFIGVNIRDSSTEAAEFLEEFDLPYPDVRDEGRKIERSYGLTGQPETFLISEDGLIHEHVNGPLTDQATLDSLLEELIERG